jgi:hypothetical protein
MYVFYFHFVTKRQGEKTMITNHDNKQTLKQHKYRHEGGT